MPSQGRSDFDFLLVNDTLVSLINSLHILIKLLIINLSNCA
jgi:hypothetical protein